VSPLQQATLSFESNSGFALFRHAEVSTYLKTQTLMPPSMSLRMMGRVEAGASFQVPIASLHGGNNTSHVSL
jgi:hypothetical protein